MAEASAAEVIRRLRRMHGHVGAKDKATLVMAIGAITDISVKLFEATHPGATVQRATRNSLRSDLQIRHLEDEESDATAPVSVP